MRLFNSHCSQSNGSPYNETISDLCINYEINFLDVFYFFNLQLKRFCCIIVKYLVNGKQSNPFHVGVGLQQGSVFTFPFHYLHEFDRQKCIQPDECAAIGNCKISRLLFAYALVLLSSTESSLQCRVVNEPISSGPNPKTNLKISQLRCFLTFAGQSFNILIVLRASGLKATSSEA